MWFAVHLSEYPPIPTDLPEKFFSTTFIEEEALSPEVINELSMNKASGK